MRGTAGVVGTLVVTAALAIVPAGAPAAGTLKGDYQLEGDRSSSAACVTAADLTDVGPGSNAFATESVNGSPNGVLTFPSDNGLRLNTAGLTPQDRYTVIMQFRLADLGSTSGTYRRLLAFDGNDPPVSDLGLYVLDGSLDFYDGADNTEATPTVGANQYIDVAFTRDSAGLINVYNNAALRVSYDDSANKIGFLAGNSIIFFRDNATDEESDGAVARIRVYDDALSPAEVLAPPGCPQVPQTCAGKQATITGTPGNDKLTGTPRRDVIAALGGNDKVSGGKGNDLICGGAGRDTLKGGAGRDTLRGEAGKDVLKGGPLEDKLIGGPGRDKELQ